MYGGHFGFKLLQAKKLIYAVWSQFNAYNPQICADNENKQISVPNLAMSSMGQGYVNLSHGSGRMRKRLYKFPL